MNNLPGDLGVHAHKVLSEGWLRPNKRIFNNAQISDHFAIIPTAHEAKNLDEMEAKMLFDMIARRFVAAFYPSAEFDITTRTSTVAKHEFKTEGKVLTFPGWLAVYGKSTVDDDAADSKALPALSPEDGSPAKAKTTESQLHSETTKPPPRYTEATLLSAMEGAGKLIEDEEFAEAMKERGLGTPATRADTIDGLINQKYMDRAQRDLMPTAKAEQLLQFLSAVKADALTLPAMTGEWEFKLRQMEHNNFSRTQFMDEVIDQTKGIVDRVKNFEEDDSVARVTDIASPTDGKPLRETLRGYKSQDGELMVHKVIGGRRNGGGRGPRARGETLHRAARRLHFRQDPQPLQRRPQAREGRREGQMEDRVRLWRQVRRLHAHRPSGPTRRPAPSCARSALQYVLREKEGDAWEADLPHRPDHVPEADPTGAGH